MANTLELYDPLFYAQEGLIVLEKALGMAARVHRDYDPTAQQKGSTIMINVPGTFSAQDAPSTAQDIVPDKTSIVLDQWKEVKFKLSDKELTYTKQDIIRDHIRPSIYALADDLDVKLAALGLQIPWSVTATNPAAIPDITALRARLFNNKAPMNESDLHLMVNGTMEAEFLNISAFSAIATAPAMEAQLRGNIGRKFGFEVFANQNVGTYTPGVSADATGAINNVGGYAKGTSTINFDGVTASGTFKKGDILVITGDAQPYTLTNDTTASSGAVTGATIFPALKQAVADDAVVTITQAAAAVSNNLAFHTHAFALAVAPLSTLGDGLGVRMAVASDPRSRLSLRSRVFYVGNESTLYVAFDVLYGYKTLNPNLAVRYHGR